MRMNTKLPEGLTGISKLMNMEKEEVRAWPYYTEVVSLFKDYNLRALRKERLIEKLSDISDKCTEEQIEFYSVGISNAISSIKVCY